MTATLDVLLDEACDPLYEAVVECTEEAIVNALCMADEMRGPGRPRRARAAARPPRARSCSATARPSQPSARKA